MPQETELVKVDVDVNGGDAVGNFLPHLAMQVFNTPLMILPAKLDIITRVLGPRIGLEGGSVSKSEMSAARAPVKTDRKGIGIVPVIGSLVHRRSGLDAMSGLTSYQRVYNDILSMADDPRVGAVLMDLATPGGVVEGAFDTADLIREISEQKPVYAFVNEHAYSAGYLLASSAKKIFLPRTGGVGSIGVRMLHVDQSEFNKKTGFAVTNLYVGERKIDFDPHSPLSKEAYESAMKELRVLYDLFADTVARNRGISAAEVKSTEAALYMGQDAVKIGLADEVMTFSEAIEFIGNDMEENQKPVARRGASKKEVKNAMSKIAEFKAENPELFDEIRAEVEADLRTSFEAKETAYEEQVAGLKGQLKDTDQEKKQLEERVLSLEKSEFIRAQKEKKDRIDNAADRIWTRALSACDIPEHMHAKVRKHVGADAFVKDDALDEEAFSQAVQAEISDWEGKGATVAVMGTGFSGKKDGSEIDPDAKSTQKMESEDEEWVKEMLALSGQVEEGGDS